MKSKKLIEILQKYPEADITLSVSNEKEHFFSDRIIEVTNQGEKQLTIIADITEVVFSPNSKNID